MKTTKITILSNGSEFPLIWVKDSKSNGKYIALTEYELNKQITGYAQLNEKAREKALKRFLDNCTVSKWAKTPIFLPNSSYPERKRICPESVQSLLQVTDLFSDPSVGTMSLGYMLTGLRLTALRRFVPDLRMALSFSDRSPAIADILSMLTSLAVTKKRWSGKKCKTKREALLDCRTGHGLVGTHFQDFSSVTVTGKHKLSTPASYADTVACILGADSAFLRAASPHMQNACVFLVGCSTSDWGSAKVSTSTITAYDPALLEMLQDNRMNIAGLLRFWWENEHENWASEIVAQAKASFGKPDSRYIAVTLDPKKLRHAVVYRVLLSFITEMEQAGLLAADLADTYREKAKQVFDPEPVEDKPEQRIEQLEVFTCLMHQLYKGNPTKIVPIDQPFVKSDKPLGAIREISGARHLVMLEADWAKAYLKAARADKIDTTFAQRPNWERELQKLLCDAGLIKAPTSGYRYRYDLFSNGTRDQTYVVAWPLSE